MRITRAALRVEAQHEESETPNASTAQFHSSARIPLGEVSANAALDPDTQDTQAQTMPAKKAKGKGGAKKGARGRKAKAADDDDDALVEVLEDERQAAGSPTSDAAADELATAPADGACP